MKISSWLVVSRRLRGRVARRVGLVVLAVVLLVTAGLCWAGYTMFWGPFRDLNALRIDQRYGDEPPGATVFYGASNFRLWTDMEDDLSPYRVQNHGIGGATDDDLLRLAPHHLYRYRPAVVFLQTGSNDLVSGKTVEQVVRDKEAMLDTFLRELPAARFVVMSSLPLPGRAQYWQDSHKINAFLRDRATGNDRVLFVDTTSLLLTAAGDFRPELFVEDGIHLNRTGQRAWAHPIREALATTHAPRKDEPAS